MIGLILTTTPTHAIIPLAFHFRGGELCVERSYYWLVCCCLSWRWGRTRRGSTTTRRRWWTHWEGSGGLSRSRLPTKPEEKSFVTRLRRPTSSFRMRGTFGVGGLGTPVSPAVGESVRLMSARVLGT